MDWINVNDRLPKIGQRVFVSYYDGMENDVQSAKYAITFESANGCLCGFITNGGSEINGVTHWMERPIPVKDKEKAIGSRVATDKRRETICGSWRAKLPQKLPKEAYSERCGIYHIEPGHTGVGRGDIRDENWVHVCTGRIVGCAVGDGYAGCRCGFADAQCKNREECIVGIANMMSEKDKLTVLASLNETVGGWIYDKETGELKISGLDKSNA